MMYLRLFGFTMIERTANPKKNVTPRIRMFVYTLGSTWSSHTLKLKELD